MIHIPQFLYILLFSLVGELLQELIPLPIPAAIYGLVLLLGALATGVLKIEHIKEASDFLISILPILFVPVSVRILEYWGIISENAVVIIAITVVSTVLVFAVSGLVTQWLMRRKEEKKHD